MVEPTSDLPFSNGHISSSEAETLPATVESNGQQAVPTGHRRVLVGDRATVGAGEAPTSVSPATPTAPPTIEAIQPSPEPTDKAATSAEQAPQRGWVWASRGLWLGVVAYVVSLAGTYMLADVAARNTAMLLLGIAAVLAVVAWGNQPWIAPFGPRIATERVPLAALLSNIGWNRAFRLVGIGVASVVLWQADRQYLVSPNETFGQAGWLW